MYWSWKKGGVLLGAVFLLAVILVKPIGVSTQFVIFDGLLMSVLNSNFIEVDESAKHGYSSSNAYLDKSGGKYASHIARPLNYGFVFVLSMVLGGFIGAKTGGKADNDVPQCHQQRFGMSSELRYGLSFLGGILVLLGARLAGGCTSGHMMSGMLQTSVSGYVFAVSAFAVAIPVAIILYGRR